ncbi:MAG: DUF4428 domain-containing protein [Oscillospiraceae bacterium]|nr:DUF4428 domain-containing protein [Oscillospiraceae bacterium]
MGLFDKKYCDFCGEKIGLLGNKKLEDGNMCKNCASRLSPWFNERRHSTKAEIQEQLDYREANKAKVAAFHTTRSIGRYTKLLLDEDQKQFMVTSASNLETANPDVLDYSQVTGCDLDIDESRNELKQTNDEGKEVSFTPPRYEYSYNFFVSIHVNHPYFDKIRYNLSNGYIKVGERPANAASGGWRVNRAGGSGLRMNDYYEYLNMGNEIKECLDNMRLGIRQEVEAQSAPKTAVTCPWCGATTVPDASGCCEYCGGSLNG